jgi:hypothetical protein
MYYVIGGICTVRQKLGGLLKQPMVLGVPRNDPVEAQVRTFRLIGMHAELMRPSTI